MYLNRLTLIGFIGADAGTKKRRSRTTIRGIPGRAKRSWKNAHGDWESE